jgi:Ca-activated chloride channel family protein
MTFDRPWLLLLLIVPQLWMIMNWRRSSRHSSLALKTLCLCAFGLAVTKPAVVYRSSRMAVAVLADTSASISDKGLKHESDVIHEMEAARGKQILHVIQFARSTRIAEKKQIESWNLARTPGSDSRATDIEEAVRDGIATLPLDYVRRLVILSDGRENVGSVLRAAGKARKLGIPIDTIPLVDRLPSTLRLEMASTPTVVFSATRFPIDFVVMSPRSASAEIVVSSQGKQMDSKHVLLGRGANRVDIATGLAAVGDVELSVDVHAGDAGDLHFSQPVTLRQRRALLISRGDAVIDTHLIDSLTSAEFEVRRKAAIPADFAADQIVLLNNWDLRGISVVRKVSFENFVRSGGVLAVLNGERDTFAKAGAREDPLQRMLPAILAPSEVGHPSCFVLVLQKSSSMDGKRLQLARLTAREVVENLRRNDLVGLLTFSNTFEWTVPIQKTSDRDSIDDVIDGVTAGGGTRLEPALHEAFRRILAVDAESKHIVLLTDGRTGDLGIPALASRATAQHVTISTVVLGDRADRNELIRMAQWTGGESLLVSNPGEVEPLLRDVFGNTGSTSLETKLIPKRRARLVTGTAAGDPRLIRWEYGLGRAEVFTSESIRHNKSSTPATVDEFWGSMVSDLPTVAPKVEVSLEDDKANDQFIINYHFDRHMHVPATDAALFVFGPHGFGIPLSIEKVSETVFRARVGCNHALGLFRVLPLSSSSAFPQVRLYKNDEELNDAGPNTPLLRSVSEVTGGRFNPVLRSIFDPDGHTAIRKIHLWPALVAMAVLLLLVNWIPRKHRDRFDQVRSAFTRTGASPQAV